MLDFTARKWKDHMVVSYQCDCGCKPMAHYYQGRAESGHEHCCCGKVHFAGPEAESQLQDYMAERQNTGDDEGLTYAFHLTEVKGPWGEMVPVAYGLPQATDDLPERDHSHEHAH